MIISPEGHPNSAGAGKLWSALSKECSGMPRSKRAEIRGLTLRERTTLENHARPSASMGLGESCSHTFPVG